MEEFDAWDRATSELDYLGLFTSASQLHGSVTAITLLGASNTDLLWELLPQVSEWWDESRAGAIRSQLETVVEGFFASAEELLNLQESTGGEYRILIPDNDDLHEGALELGAWCAAFLQTFRALDMREGLGIVQRSTVQELLGELDEVAQLADGVDLQGASEDDLLIIVDQVGICVTLLALDIQAPPGSQDTDLDELE